MFLLETFTLLLAVKHKNCFIGCVEGQIIFGKVNSRQFEDNYSVIINLTDIVDVYCGIIKLLSCTVNGPYPSEKINFLKTSSWQALSRNNIVLIIEKNKSQKTLEFDYESFNSLLFCFAKVLLPSLGLNEKEKLLLHKIISLPIDSIVMLKDPQKCFLYCNDLDNREKVDAFNLSTLISHYCDVLIVYKKILSIWDESFNNSSIERILMSNE
jgi:hypothetical protein